MKSSILVKYKFSLGHNTDKFCTLAYRFISRITLLLFLVVLSGIITSLSVQAQTTNTTVSDGNYNGASTWSLNREPNAQDIVVIKHAVVVNDGDFWVGGQNGTASTTRDYTITSTGSLTIKNKIIIRNNGSKLINHGKLIINSTQTDAIQINSGVFENHGEAIVEGGIVLQNGNTSLIDNNGTLLVKSTGDNSLLVNQGRVFNYGSIDVKGRLNLASGVQNPVRNYGVLKADRVYLNNSSSIENWGKMFAVKSIDNQNGTIINYPCAYIEQQTAQPGVTNTEQAFFKNNNSPAKITNNGFILIKGNFTNKSGSIFDGSGTTHFEGYSANVNRGFIKGDQCIYDATAIAGGKIVDLNDTQGGSIIDNTVKSCANATPPNQEAPAISLTNPIRFCNLSDTPFTYEIPNRQAGVTYTLSDIPEGIMVDEVSPGVYNFVAFAEDEQIGQAQYITVTASNKCNSSSAKLTVIIEDCSIATPLPVTLTTFTATSKKSGVVLNWATATEINNEKFEIERSTDGKSFQKIGEVTGAGNSQILLSYTFTDLNPVDGTAYYRLKQTDYDGTTENSKTVSVKSQLTSNVQAAKIYPNPFQENLNIELTNTPEVQTMITLTDMSGKLVKSLIGQAGQQSFAIEDIKQLPAGFYLLKIQQGQKVSTHKLVKNK